MTKVAGSGRKPLDKNSPSIVVTVRMTQEQRDIKLVALGGPMWIRQMIDYAYAATQKKGP